MKKIAIMLLVILASCSTCFADYKYDRSKFKHWIDADGDGLSTRQEMIYEAVKVGITCRYTGEFISDPSKTDIDHIIPLKWAWEHGAAIWSDSRREAFANDPDNLIVVDASINRHKGAKGPEEWLPPNTFYIPTYARSWISICKKYELGCDYDELNSVIFKYTHIKSGIRPR